MLIAIIGPDGSGKTTLANQLLDHISSSANQTSSIRFFELRAQRFPSLQNIFRINLLYSRRAHNASKNVISGSLFSGMVKPKSILVATANICWYSLEYLVERFSTINQDDFVDIYARYSCDYLFVRAYRNTPLWLKKIPYLLSKKPDFIFYVRRPSLAIFHQKPELTVDEIELQDKLIMKYFSKLPNFFLLPADTIENTTFDCAIHVLNNSSSYK